MQHEKIQIYTLKINTINWHWKNAITFEQGCMCSINLFEFEYELGICIEIQKSVSKLLAW